MNRNQAAIEPLWTQDDLAERFRVTTRTIRQWTADGRLGCIRIGRVIRYTPAHVEALIASADHGQDAA